MQKLGSMRIPISFWPLQLLGWLGFATATAVSFWPLRHIQFQVVYREVFVVSIFLASFVLRQLCRRLWQKRVSLVTALAWCGMGSYVLGVLCVAPAIWAQRRLGCSEELFTWNYLLAAGIGAAFILVAWSALYFGFKQFRLVEDQRVAILMAESTARSAQLQALQYQLQPHFLFNTLNSISSLIVSGQADQATLMIAHLGVLLRSSLEMPEVHTIALTDELVTVEEYLAIERARFGPRLSVSYEIAPAVMTAQVPRFLLQPLIENAVRYGIAESPIAGDITLRAQLTGYALRIEIENMFPDWVTAKAIGSGLGLSNSRKRLEQLYGAGSSLTTAISDDNRFLAVVTLPFEPENLALEHFEKAVPA